MEIITSKQLQLAFQSVLDKSSNQKYIIDNELNSILNYISTIPNTKFFQKKRIPDFSQKSNSVFKLNVPDLGRALLNEAFNSILNTGRFETPETFNDTNETLEFKKAITKQAFEFADYYNWLQNFGSKKTKAKTISLNHQEKMLALCYLGMDTTNFDNNKIAKILSVVLGLSEQNTREILGSLYINAKNNPVRTKSHLEKLSNQFENIGLSEISERIKKDINDLK